MNTVSFYMRILRAVYKRAVGRGFVRQQDPFRHVYTGVDNAPQKKRVRPDFYSPVGLIANKRKLPFNP